MPSSLARLISLPIFCSLFFHSNFSYTNNNFDLFYDYYGKEIAHFVAGHETRIASSEDLKWELFDAINRGKRSIGYKRAKLFLLTDERFHLKRDSRGEFYIHSVYCQRDFTNKDTAIGPGQLPNHTVLNIEHTWPQSKFCRTGCRNSSKGERKSDMHHLFPSDSHVNSDRGNHPFGEVFNPIKNRVECLQDRRGDRSTVGVEAYLGRGSATSVTVFEPPLEHKGNVARAMLYFSLMYDEPLTEREEELFRHWNEIDPVDQAERDRNEAIYQIQGNRNPFIDESLFADLIEDF